MAQTVLITGGSRGIGAACVRVFAENGWNTAFTYSKSREAADRLAGETGALALSADQQDTAAVELAVAEGKARFGTIDAVVCNAGIAERKLFQNITDADWMHMLDVNLMGTVRTIRAVLPEMLHNHKGSIVTVSSMWGECGASCESHYSASKAAIIGLSKSLAQELGPSNIRVNCIAPGVIDTDMNAMHSISIITAYRRRRTILWTRTVLCRASAIRTVRGTAADRLKARTILCMVSV